MYQVPGETARFSQMPVLPSGLLSLVREGRHNFKQPLEQKKIDVIKDK